MNNLLQVYGAGDRATTVLLTELRKQGVPFLTPHFRKNDLILRSSREALRRQLKKPQGYVVILCRERDVSLIKLLATGRVQIYR